MTEPYFDRLADKYRCCCGLMHVETGTKIICGVALLSYLVSTFIFIFSGPTTVWGNGEWARLVIGTLLVGGPLVGLKKNAPWMFIPYLVFSFLSIFGLMLQIPIMLIGIISKSTFGEDIRKMIAHMYHDKPVTDPAIYGIMWKILIESIIMGLFSIWFFTVVYKCYKYVDDKKKAGYNEVILPSASVPEPNAMPPPPAYA